MALIPAANLPPAGAWSPNVLHGIGVVGGIPPRTDPANIIALTIANPNDTAANDAAFNAAKAIANNANKVILFPAGTIKVSGFDFYTTGPTHTNFTVRGAGMGLTTLMIQSQGHGFGFGSGIPFNPGWFSTSVDKASLTKGATSITLTDPAPSGHTWPTAGGGMVLMRLPNDSVKPVAGVKNGSMELRHMVFVMTGRSGSTLNITPAIPEDLTGLPSNPAIELGVGPDTGVSLIQGVGVEDMTIDGLQHGGSGMRYGIYFLGAAYNCWVKNVKVRNALYQSGKGMYLDSSVNCEVRGCWIEPSGLVGPNLSGIMISNTTSCWIEDCIGEQNQPVIEGWLNNLYAAITYNYIPRGSFTLCIQFHATHSSFCLIEGNITPSVIANDGYGGSTSEMIIARNWLTTINEGVQIYSAVLSRFTRGSAGVGNVLYSPGYSWAGSYAVAPIGFNLGEPYNGGQVGTAQHSLGAGSTWPDWDWAAGRCKIWQAEIMTLGAPDPNFSTGTISLVNSALGDEFEASTVKAKGGSRRRSPGTQDFFTLGARSGNTWPWSNATGEIGIVGQILNIAPSVDGFNELDLDVAATTTLKGNWNYTSGTSGAVSSTGGDTVPDSFIYSSKPAWMGTLAWPPLNTADGLRPTAYDIPNFARLPAAWRYHYGNTAYLGGSSVPTAPSALSATTISSTQINLAWTDNSDDETGFEILRGTTSGSLSVIGTAAANATSYNNTGLASATRYYYAVQAYSGGGNSASSNEANALTDTVSGGAPFNFPAAPAFEEVYTLGTRSWYFNGIGWRRGLPP